MRMMAGLVLACLGGCNAEEAQRAIPEADDISRSRLQGVTLSGDIYDFEVDTEDGWGWADVRSGADVDKHYFIFNIRGHGSGIVMAQVGVVGIDAATLVVGDQIDLSTEEPELSDVGIDVVGCGGETNHNWDVDLGRRGGALEVIARQEDMITFHVYILFETPDEEAWVNAVVSLPLTPEKAITENNL